MNDSYEDLKLSFYQYDDIEKLFINYVIELCLKYPFKFHYYLKNVFSSPQITYLKDTTMIINLSFLTLDRQQDLFQFLRKLLQMKALTKVIDKKEFLITHLYSNKISEFFRYPTSWLGYLFHYVYTNLYPYEPCQLGVVVNKVNYFDIYLERMGTPFIIFSCDREDQKQEDERLSNQLFKQIKKVFLYSTDDHFWTLSRGKEPYETLEYRYNIGKFQISVKNYFDNPCNLLRFVV